METKTVRFSYVDHRAALSAFRCVESLPAQKPGDFYCVEVDFDDFTVTLTGHPASLEQLVQLHRVSAAS